MATQLIIPITMAFIITYGLIKKIPVFSCFTEGAKNGFSTMYAIAPSLIGLITAIGMFKASGALEILTTLLSPFTEFIGLPSEVSPLFFLKPISGSGSLAMLSQIVSDNGANSTISKIAAVMTGSTETTFYCIAVYYGTTQIKKTGCTVPSAILGDIAGMIMATVAVKVMG